MRSEIVSLDQLDLSGRYSYADYFSWKFKERVELIRGFIHKMSPAPGPRHQLVSVFLSSTFYTFFKDKPCMVFAAPFDVRFPDSRKHIGDKEIFNVVQPDLCVICDPDKIDARGCLGAPDLVIEILSPENSKKEMGIKFRLYEENGIKEYWMVDPSEKIVDVYVLKNGRYEGQQPLTESHEIHSVLFPELKFSIKEAFEDLKTGNMVHEPAVAYGLEVTSLDQLDFSRIYTYADYLRWKFEERVELIRGAIHKMSPAPTFTHQKTALKLVRKLDTYFEHQKCEMLFAPFDVRLPDAKKQTGDFAVFTVVQPDICVICDPAKIDERGGIGAPDLIIEILSPGNSQRDVGIKFELYEENGVKEYWLVDPKGKTVRLYTLTDGKYMGKKPFTEDEEISSVLFPELKFSLKEVFG